MTMLPDQNAARHVHTKLLPLYDYLYRDICDKHLLQTSLDDLQNSVSSRLVSL